MTDITPNTFIVGAGPVATALAGSLRLGGVPVLGLWARSEPAARRAGSISGVASFSPAPPDSLLEADVVIFAVRDDAVAEVAEKLIATGLITSKHTFMHCSGALSAEAALGPVLDRIGGAATLHPLRSLPRAQNTLANLKGSVFGVEGNQRGVSQAKALVAAMEGHALELQGDQMVLYHAAASIASNYLVTLLDAAGIVMSEAGVEKAEGVKALLGLAKGTLESIEQRGTEKALTGPIRRGDATTVASHINALPSDALELYKLLGLKTLDLAKTNAGGYLSAPLRNAESTKDDSHESSDWREIKSLLSKKAGVAAPLPGSFKASASGEDSQNTF